MSAYEAVRDIREMALDLEGELEDRKAGDVLLGQVMVTFYGDEDEPTWTGALHEALLILTSPDAALPGQVSVSIEDDP